MLYQQIPTLFYSLGPRFAVKESVKITHSQFEQLYELISDYCYSHDVPRLKSTMRRVARRMRQPSGDHLWNAEFEYISEHLLTAMKEVGYCRDSDDRESIVDILNREALGTDRRVGHFNRSTDQPPIWQQVKKFVKERLH